MKNVYILVALALTFAACQKESSRSSDKEKFVQDLMSKMTLEEKIGQLNLPSAGDFVTGSKSNSDFEKKVMEGKVGGIFNIGSVEKMHAIQKIAVEKSRLKIPLIFGMDVIHGKETVFPIPLGLSCSWDMELIKKTAQLAAKEASNGGICWTFSPMVDICRDARWGRIAEGSGEDAFLGSKIAVAMTQGYQGNDLSAPNTIMACAKHFALYGGAEAGRDYNTVDMSAVRMYNDYLPPFKAFVEAGGGSLMPSFNEINGVPATGNKWLLTDVLRNEWGFNGFLVSDFTGISEMIDHGIADSVGVAKLAIEAGCDMDMVSESYLKFLPELIKNKQVDEKFINQSCKRILEAKYDLGLFADPFRYGNVEKVKTENFSAPHRQFSREVAGQSFVLLKNENVLPLSKKAKIALVGPLADSWVNMTGTWSIAPGNDVVTVKEGIEQALQGGQLFYAKGANLEEDEELEKRVSPFGKTFQRDTRPAEVILREALTIAQKADVIVAALGESAEMSGECSSRVNIEIPATQKKLLQALLQTKKPVVLVLFNGRPLVLKEEKATVPAILDVWFGGTETGAAVADVLFGDVNPSGKLTTSFPQHLGQVPIYYNHKNTGRPLPEGKGFEKFRSNYLDVPNEPLYPFGYGLSYTTFAYGTPTLSKNEMSVSDSVRVSVEVKNTGNRAGKETVQLYIRDMISSITRPVKELKGFEKITIQPQESKTVSFTLTQKELGYYYQDLKWKCEPGKYRIMVGSNSKDVQTVELTVK